MKRTLYLLICLSVLAWTMQSCSDDNKAETPPTSDPEISFPAGSETQPVFATEGGTSTLTFTASEAWTASVGEANTRAIDWLTVSPTSGQAGTATLTITTEPNTTYDERNAAIILTSGSTRKTLTVTQKQQDALTVTSNKVELEATGGEFSIELQSNITVSYEIAENAQTWLTPASDTRALTTTTLRFQAATNEDLQPRQGVITLSGGDGLTEEVIVYQAGSGPVLILTQKEYLVGSDGETIQVELKSNNTYQIEMPSVDWITEADTRALSTYTHYFTVAPNDTYDAREAVIRFVDEENGLEQTVSIQQMQRDAIVVAQSIYEIGAEGGALDFAVQANVDFTVSTDADWITQIETRGLTERVLHFDVAANESEEAREATIILSSESAGMEQMMKVYQAGKVNTPFLQLSIQEYTASARGELFDVTVQSNVAYQLIMPEVDWLVHTASDGGAYTFEVLPNNTYDARTAEIRFVCEEEGLSESLIVTQMQRNAIVIAQDFYEVEAEGGTLDIPVQANVDFTVSTNADWITQIDTSTKGLIEKVLKFNIEANSTLNSREAIITLTANNGIQQDILVKQSGVIPFIKITSSPTRISKEAQDIAITVESNIDYYFMVESDVEWIFYRDAYPNQIIDGIFTSTHTFGVSDNRTSDIRSGHISFFIEEYNIRETITIEQDGQVSIAPDIDDIINSEW